MNKSALFPLLPVAVQNLLFSLYGWQKKKQRYGREFKAILNELKETDYFTRDEIREYQNRKLELIFKELANIPYYRTKYKELGIDISRLHNIDDLSLLPILTKREVKVMPEQFISERFDKKKLLITRTSGTTGSPLTVYLSAEAMQYKWATFWRHRARFGFYPGEKFLMFGAHLPVLTTRSNQTFWRVNKAINQHYVSTHDLREDNFKLLVEYMNHEQFKYIVGYPSAVYNFVVMMQNHNLKLDYQPVAFFSASDVLLPVHAEAISSYLGTKVTDFYGSVEFCGSFSGCKEGSYHLDFESGIVEFLPITGNEDSEYKKVIFTSLANPAMPFMRYEIGDYAQLTDAVCPCGRSSISIKKVEGRLEDSIRTADGRTIIKFGQVFKNISNIRTAQIIQTAINSITVKVVPEDDYNPADEKKLIKLLTDRLGSQMNIHIEKTKNIAPAPNGKQRLVISQLPPHSPGEQSTKDQITGRT